MTDALGLPILVGALLIGVLALSGGLALFGGTQWLGGSGFLAAYLGGIVVSHRLEQGQAQIHGFHDGLAWLSQIMLFVMLGLLVRPKFLNAELLEAVVVAGTLMLLARPLATLVCLIPFGFGWREQAFMGWMGLRGAVPIFLAIIPVISPGPVTSQFFNIVFIVVIASLLLQGWSGAWLARRLGLQAADPS